MRSFLQKAYRFLQAEDGPTAVEYAVMLAMIIIVCFVAIQILGQNTNSVFANPELNNTLSGTSTT
jgi:pilus assembly protein Flp/PilA